MSQIQKTCSVTNGSQAVSVPGVNLTAQILQNYVFMLVGSLVPYTVAANSTFDGTDTNIVLTGAYQGSTNAAATGVFVADYTYPNMIPVLSQGDVGTAAIFTAAMYKVQQLITVAAPGGLVDYQNLATAIDGDAATIAADKVTVQAALATVVAADATVSTNATAVSTALTAATLAKTDAETAAAAALANKNLADTSAADADAAASAAAASAATASTASGLLTAALSGFRAVYVGEHPTDPLLDGNGNPLVEGAQYLNTTTNRIMVYDMGVWELQDADMDLSIANAQASEAAAAASANAASVSASGALTSKNAALASQVAAAASATSAGSSVTSAAASATTATTKATAAAASATAAAASATTATTKAAAAAASATTAAASATTATGAAATATTAATTATTQAGIATTAAGTATTAVTSSGSNATAASGSATAAAGSATAAGTSATNAAASATSASNSATAAAGSVASVATSATNAATSATNAATSATNAATSAASALADKNTVATYATTTLNSENSATTSAGIATTQAASAQTSATAAASSATSASASAAVATTQSSAATVAAANSASQATTATTQAVTASGAATSATTSASAASASANTASTHAANAAASSSSAGSSSSSAVASASAAATSAATSQAQAVISTAQAVLSADSASSASTSKVNALTSEAKAALWADQTQNVQVETGRYSAKHWALQAQASVTGSVIYRGLFSAAEGAYPTLPSLGDYYVISIGGTISAVTYVAGDSIIYNGSSWDKASSGSNISSVNGQTGVVVLTKADVGLSNVNNTADGSKPISTAQQAALDLKATTSSLAAVATDGLYSSLAGAPPAYVLPSANGVTLGGVLSSSSVLIDLDGTATVTLASIGAKASSYVPSWPEVTSKPTTLAGFGIVDAQAALGFTPYNVTNPSNYITAAGAPVQSIGGFVGTVTKLQLGISNVDNTSDASKPVSTAQATANTAVGTAAASDATTKANAAQAAAIAASAPVAHVGAAGTAHAAATTSTAGFMSGADKTKLDGVATGATANTGTVTAVSGTAPVVSSGGATPAISMAAATTAVPGYLTAADWNTFNGKQAALGYTAQNVASKDVSGGYAGLTLLKLNLKNAANTIINFFQIVTNTAARTWTMPDKDGTVAMTNDITDTLITGKVITNYVSGAGTVAATDTILQAINKLNGNDGLKANIASPVFTGVSSNAAGTALLPSIIPTGDPNTGIWFPAADTVAISTAGLERLRLSSTGVLTLAAGTATISGNNSGDNAINSLYSGLVTNATHSGDVTGSTALTIAANAVTNAKAAQMAVNTIKGRITAGTGTSEDLSAANVRTIINVADGANNYVHPTGDGNSHVPATSTTSLNKVLVAGATANVFAWNTLDMSYLPDAAFKKSVRVATTANIGSSFLSGVITGPLAVLTIDGIAVALNDRILVKDQTAALQNGIYYVSTVGTVAIAWVLTRTTDADSITEIAGAIVNVDSATEGARLYTNNLKTTDTLNTTAITWSRIIDTSMAGAVVGATPAVSAATGVSLNYARQDHVHPTQTTITGNAANVTGIVLGANGGTGVANTSKTITLGGNLTTSGLFATTLTSTAATSVTLPTSGTLLSTAAAVTVAQGGTGATTLTGVLKGNGTGAFTAAVANTDYVAPVGADGVFTRQMLKDCGLGFLDKGNSGTTTQTLDYTAGSHQRIATTGAHTIATSNWPPTGNLGEILLELVNGAAFTITWPTINWVKSDGTFTTTFSANGVTLQTSGTDFVVLWSRNGGTTIYGKVVR